MKIPFTKRLIIALWFSFLLAVSILAISSTHYRLDWYTPLTTGGGGTSSSAGYTVQFSVGQTATQPSTSTHYKVGMGFWYGETQNPKLYLPVIVK